MKKSEKDRISLKTPTRMTCMDSIWRQLGQQFNVVSSLLSHFRCVCCVHYWMLLFVCLTVITSITWISCWNNQPVTMIINMAHNNIEMRFACSCLQKIHRQASDSNSYDCMYRIVTCGMSVASLFAYIVMHITHECILRHGKFLKRHNFLPLPWIYRVDHCEIRCRFFSSLVCHIFC